MPILTQAEYVLGDVLVRFQAPADRPDAWGLVVLPVHLRDRTLMPREWLEAPAVRGLPSAWNRISAWEIDPLVHAHVTGDALPGGYAQGRTLRHSATTQGLTVQEHGCVSEDARTVVRTTLVSTRGFYCVHEVIHSLGSGVIEIRTTAENRSEKALSIELLSSFSVGGITPFAADDAAGRLKIHRFRSAWSAEGRPETCSVEALQLERSWTGHGMRSERFGQAGSLPVNGWFPFVGIEDSTAGVTWAAQIASPATWHLEISRRADQLALSGGGADRLLGEWHKVLAPGESFTAPPAWVTVIQGGLEAVCSRLVTEQRRRAAARPPGEDDMPVVFNEWCTSWGHPTHDRLVHLAAKLSGSGVKYLVIDDGWAERKGDRFQQNGDWRVNRRAFPSGLRTTTDAIRSHGLIPGLWFEFEAVNPGSDAWSETAHQLHRDGVPLQVGPRRFWDFRDPWVHDYLADRVLARLRDDGFGYLKIDCNDSTGPGVDGPESPGENLRQHIAGVQRFLVRLRSELPGLVIENCSSGGHRLEPSMLALTAMSSISDAHETPDIPIIAANLNSLVWSAQKQIWAVVRRGDTVRRLAYSLAASFLGRMCLSGDIQMLDETAARFVREAVDFYREVAPVIRDGEFRCRRNIGESYQHPTGWQVVTVEAGRQLLVVWHRFGGAASGMEINLPGAANWRVERTLDPESLGPISTGSRLMWSSATEWSGGVLLLATE
ncbi:MAG: alpha-galactosidase [Opitutaceae bacterium]|nr:alpha-galactosidase [Opitutaceae bacterium]